MASVTTIIHRRRKRKARRRIAQGRNRWWAALIGVIVLLLVVVPAGMAFGSAALVYAQAASLLPAPQETIAREPQAGYTRLFDRSGDVLLYTVQDPLGSRRAWVSLEDLPPYIAQATLLMEDPDFLEVTRFDAARTLSKLWQNFLAGPLPADPTLTGRLVRNVIAPAPEVIGVETAAREIALVAEINRLYTPEQVLEWHLNTNDYGNEVYGIDAAAQYYLGKRAVDLTLDEAALLAAVPVAPEYNPLENETAARRRQSDTLRLMLAEHLISQEAYTQAANSVTPILQEAAQTPSIAPEFATYARRQAEHILNTLGRDGARLVARGGLKITTTLDVDLYLQTECALRAHLAHLRAESFDGLTLTGGPCSSAAFLPQGPGFSGGILPDKGEVVILDAATGEIRSMVGAVSRASHQPGVTLFPFVYLTGFLSPELNLNAGTMVLDIPRQFPGAAEGLIYTPNNPDGRFSGPINLRDAMGAGLLPPAAAVAQSKGINNVLTIAHQIGVNTLDSGLYDLSLLERGGEVSLLDMAYSYSVFASLGQRIGIYRDPIRPRFRSRDPVAILRIEDANGEVLWEYQIDQTGANCTPLNCEPIFEPGFGYIINDILSDQRTRWPVIGENNVLDLPRRAAVVNGLTGDDRDNWTLGYTPQMVVGVTLNRADGVPMTLDPYGLQGAAPVWRAVMLYAHTRDALPEAVWPRPASIVEARICQRSGMSYNGICPSRTEIFVSGTERALSEDSYWQLVEINSLTNQRATASTPAGVRSTQVYFVPPPEAMDWWRANNQPLPPTQFDTVTLPDELGATQILRPLQFDSVGGVVDIRGSMDESNMQYYQLSYGAGYNPERFFDITGQQTAYTPGTTLGLWDTTNLPDGLYTLRLVVVLSDNTLDAKVINITVDNTAPVITLSAGEAGQTFTWPDDETITLAAEVNDIKVDRVEFYHNGQFLGADTDWPYGFNFRINRTGIEIFSATAFDAVGNSASAEVQVEVVRSGP